MSAALAAGQVASWLAASSAERAKRLASRKIPITGTSMFPKLDEEPLTDVFARPARPAYTGLAKHRDSEVFEGLRDRSRRHAAAHGSAPKVVLACLGERRDFGGREQFTSNLLWVGGLAFDELEGPSPEAITAAAKQAKTNLVILASSASVYAEQAIAAAEAAKAAGLSVWIAGRRAETGSDKAVEVIDGEIFDGMDIVEFLTNTLDGLGVAK
jgi:methylmalonyl-CoA mutase